MSEPLLRVERLSAAFDRGGAGTPVVNDVSFQIDAGETLCLVGESGSGKSITALSIVRLLPPGARLLSGTISLRGRDLLQLEESAMDRVRGAEIGFVFQEPMTALNPVFTVGRQIEETLLLHRLATRRSVRARAIELLAAVGILDPQRRVDAYPHQLSGGLRQRAMIAIALACRPRLLIADEPTTALDATIQAQILELLRDLRATFGLGLLLITHDLGIVAAMADRVAVMRSGEIVEHCSVDTLFTRAQHPYTRQLLAAIPGARP